MLVLASLVLDFAILNALCGLDLVWLHSMPMRPYLDVTIWEAFPDAGLLRTYPFPFRSVWCYAYHVCSCYPLAFYASLHACSHVHAWVMLASVSHMLQHNEVMDIRSKPTFVPRGHNLFFALLLVCLFACLLAFLFLCLPCLSYLSTLRLLHMLFASFPCIACLLASFLCLCMCTLEARTHEAKARSPKRKQKGRGCEHVDKSQTLFLIDLGV